LNVALSSGNGRHWTLFPAFDAISKCRLFLVASSPSGPAADRIRQSVVCLPSLSRPSRTTLALEFLFDGDAQGLAQKAIGLAPSGDMR
jgi:hypothetical protein